MATAAGTDGGPGTSCKGCHGTHDVGRLDDADSRFHPSRLSEGCGECHRTVAEHYEASEHGQALSEGIEVAPSCITCHVNPITHARSAGTAEAKVEQERICLSCHLDNPEVRSRMGPGAGFIASYGKSVHGTALRKGNAGAATCVDCHGSHEMRRGADPEARVSKAHIPETCAGCHGEIADAYAESVHSAAVRRGNPDAPVCTDCHGEHDILWHGDPNSPVSAGNVSAQVCSPCHSSLALSEKYGIASDRFQTFADSYHGLALRSGSLEVANCASCHGSHDIKSPDDPASTVHKANLAETCGRCHPGANDRFAVGAVHVQVSEEKEPVLYWIAYAYIVLIVVTIGGMLVHNILDFIRRTVRRLKIRTGRVRGAMAGQAQYVRMTLNERIQHASLALSFTVLVVTGFMLRYPEAWWVVWIRGLSDEAFELRSLLHRVAGVVMAAASLYHLGYVAFTRRGRRLAVDLLPNAKVARDAVANVRYNLALSRKKPAFARFSYVEKSEYWALVWGTVVMLVTGGVMWFENTFIGLLTKVGFDIAWTVHFYEAWLATLAIIAWHFYYVIFNPDVYPMNTAWLTGRTTEAEMAEEHPLALAALKEQEATATKTPTKEAAS